MGPCTERTAGSGAAMRAVSLVGMNGAAKAPAGAPANISGATNVAAAAARRTARSTGADRATVAACSTARARFMPRVVVAARAIGPAVVGKCSALRVSTVTVAVEWPAYAYTDALLMLSAVHLTRRARSLWP